MRWLPALAVAGLASIAPVPGARAADDATDAPGRAFVHFESGHVRPLSLSEDGTRLFAVNTPAATLEVFDVTPAGLTHAATVPVGLEPVAVAVRTPGEVWVVNHVSDSVSVVDVAASPPRVVRTLAVGDEPRDLVFAGTVRPRAFVTAARRGQNRPGDPQLTTPGVGRADVWVFDAQDPGDAPVTVLSLFGDTPRALAVSPDGSTVYAAVFHSGNRTTTVHEAAVRDGFDTAAAGNSNGSVVPGGLPGPRTNRSGVRAPETGLIVRHDGAAWRDAEGRDWGGAVRFSLPDLDVFAIDADAPVPVQTGAWAGVGTILFGLAVNPATGRIYVSNTEARNEVRFEGRGRFGGSTVRSRLHLAQVTVLGPQSSVTPRHLNPHIDYDRVPGPASAARRTLATPVGIEVSSDGATIHVAAMGSGKVAFLDAAAIESGTYRPDARDHVTVSGGGPTGLALDETRGRIYVATRFDNGISVIDTASRRETAHVRMGDAEPAQVRRGRRFLYDAALTSGNGEASCASCHVFGDLDSLAWDLGDPDGEVATNPNPILLDSPFPIVTRDFHPMKGPMTTQSLRGMADHGPLHWRGDRTGGARGGDPMDERAAFVEFNGAFPALLGRKRPLTDGQMRAFADFALALRYPPNPVRALDGSLTPDQQSARDRYFGPTSDAFGNCHTCHVLDPANGSFGSGGGTTFEAETQMFKVPHLRNLYQKVGMFGMAPSPFFLPGDHAPQGDQVRGFGFLHDGSTDTLARFLSTVLFTRGAGNPGGFETDADRRQMESFLLAFDTGLAPVVGQQVTLGPGAAAGASTRADLLVARAAAGDCDVVVRGVTGGVARGWVRDASGAFVPDRTGDATTTDAALRALAAGGAMLTWTAVPPGTGVRLGNDRDADGHLDRDEIAAGSDPSDAGSVPPGAAPCIAADGSARVRVGRAALPLGDETLRIDATFSAAGSAAEGPAFDPAASGLRLAVLADAATPARAEHRITVPPGASWRTTTRGATTTWTFDDPEGLVADGVTRVVVRRSDTGSGSSYRLALRGRGAFRVSAPAAAICVAAGGAALLVTAGQ